MIILKNRAILPAIVGLLMLSAVPAVADWDVGDAYKMHFPQLPDPNGWDVAYSQVMLADDWRCSETGPVSDIHFWISFRQWSEEKVPQSMDLAQVQLQIWSNIPDAGNGYSTPEKILWDRTFGPDEYSIRYAGFGEQGWCDLISGTEELNDHSSYFQINIDKIVEPFVQEEGTVYWLAANVLGVEGTNQPGWKTADVDRYPEPYIGQPYEDTAVFFYGEWYQVEIEGRPRDFAFVITTIPEPSSLVLLGMAGMGAILFFRRKRRAE